MQFDKRIEILVGIPGSGKSTYAHEQVQKSDGRTIRINKDDIRAQLFNDKFSKTRENTVVETRNAMIGVGIQSPRVKTIIVDDTNLNTKHHTAIRELAEEYEQNLNNKTIEVVLKLFDTSLDPNICHQRNIERNRSVPYHVIENMYQKYMQFHLEHNTPLPYPATNPDGRDAVIFDIDGTLAHRNGRSPYDTSQVSSDTVDFVLSDLLDYYRNKNYSIILLSGRDASCRALTEEWLETYHIDYDELHMRSEGSRDRDFLIKFNLYKDYVFPYYNVRLVFDDRYQVVRMWRALGIRCFQVADGMF